MDVCIIIPARAGSKGIPNKNLKPLWGVPLVDYTIHQALSDGFPPKNIILSSDSDQILQRGNHYGINSIKRPQSLAADNTSTEDVIAFHLKEFKTLPELTILLQPTSPIRKKGRIKEALNFIINNSFDSILSVTPFHGFIWYKDKGKIKSDYDPIKRPRRQELEEKKFLENGSIYIFKSNGVLQHKSRLFGKIGLFKMSREESIELDSIEDWEILENMPQIKKTINWERF